MMNENKRTSKEEMLRYKYENQTIRNLAILGLSLCIISAIFLTFVYFVSLECNKSKCNYYSDELVTLEAENGLYADYPSGKIKNYLCEENAVYEHLTCQSCSFWVKSGKCVLLVEVCT